MTDPKADIQENLIMDLSPALLSTLLIDRTLSCGGQPVNIFWATDTLLTPAGRERRVCGFRIFCVSLHADSYGCTLMFNYN